MFLYIDITSRPGIPIITIVRRITFSGVARRRKSGGGGHKFFFRHFPEKKWKAKKKKKKKKKVTGAQKHMGGGLYS